MSRHPHRAATIALAAWLGMLPMSQVHAGATKGSITISGRPPTLVAVPTLSFAPVSIATLAAAPQTSHLQTSAGTLEIDDFSGQLVGWQLSVTYLPFMHEAQTLATNFLSISGDIMALQSNGTSDERLDLTPPLRDNMLEPNTQTVIWQALPGKGMGRNVAQIQGAALSLPQQLVRQAGSYTSILTWTLTTLPPATAP